jgi:hypothetical protein
VQARAWLAQSIPLFLGYISNCQKKKKKKKKEKRFFC